MYEKLSTNNKLHLMKKLFNLTVGEGGLVVEHMNEFNIIVNQPSFVEINSMRAVPSNSIGNSNLKFNDVKDQILVEELRKKNPGEATTSNFALNVRTRGRS